MEKPSVDFILLKARQRAMQKCSRHFCPGSGTIFKEPASGGFLHFSRRLILSRALFYAGLD
ncbi:MAG: hypothetical protein KIB40_19185 [Pantoea sp.]|uniref:hypothetical protein n=1 Tax=Pantoea sp. TaxID=69393 RepID=UPI0025799DD7|nr:hypothetical protein [Pantoea sp.]MBS6035240.1 hypothetical protein [Pantoea sp.]